MSSMEVESSVEVNDSKFVFASIIICDGISEGVVSSFNIL